MLLVASGIDFPRPLRNSGLGLRGEEEGRASTHFFCLRVSFLPSKGNHTNWADPVRGQVQGPFSLHFSPGVVMETAGTKQVHGRNVPQLFVILPF